MTRPLILAAALLPMAAGAQNVVNNPRSWVQNGDGQKQTCRHGADRAGQRRPQHGGVVA